jgi:hypothetical protein
VIPYFGRLPQSAPYYFESVRQAHLIDVLLFTDAQITFPVPSNVKIFPFTLSAFNDLASRALGSPVELREAYKLCDFKPAYGAIFSSYIRDYKYWAAGDVDLVYGNLSLFLEPLLSKEYDIISCKRGWISGSLFVCRNSLVVNSAYAKNPDWPYVSRAPQNLYFDEMGGHFYGAVQNGADLLSLKGSVESFTHTVIKLSRSGAVRSWFSDLACEGLAWGDTLCYGDGTLTRISSGSQVMYLHWVSMKRRFFRVPPIEAAPRKFLIRKTGIYTEREYLCMLPLREGTRVARGAAAGFGRLLGKFVPRAEPALAESRSVLSNESHAESTAAPKMSRASTFARDRI